MKISNKKQYKLSEASKKTKTEYGEVNTVTSLIYNRFKQVMDLYWDRNKLQKLRSLILKVIRSGPEEMVGSRKLWDGDVKMFEGFQLNTKATASNLFKNTFVMHLGRGGHLKVAIPKFNYAHAFEKAHPKATFAMIKFFVFSFDLENNTSKGKSIILLHQKHKVDLQEDFEVDIILENNHLNLIVYKVSFLRDPNDYESLDRQFIGATVLKAIYIKDGAEVVYVPEEKVQEPLKPPSLPGEWEDLK